MEGYQKMRSLEEIRSVRSHLAAKAGSSSITAREKYEMTVMVKTLKWVLGVTEELEHS